LLNPTLSDPWEILRRTLDDTNVESSFAICRNPNQIVVLARIVPLKRANSDSKLLLPGKLFARLQENETITVHATFAFSHRVIPVVLYEILVDGDD
jgi:hypothetical protein